MASRSDSFGGGKGGRWGYKGNFRGRENTGPRQFTRFSGGKMNGGDYSNGGKQGNIEQVTF